jgi:hypothetical protein
MVLIKLLLIQYIHMSQLIQLELLKGRLMHAIYPSYRNYGIIVAAMVHYVYMLMADMMSL